MFISMRSKSEAVKCPSSQAKATFLVKPAVGSHLLGFLETELARSQFEERPSRWIVRPMIPIAVTKARVLEVLWVKVEVSCPLVNISDATGVRRSDSWNIVAIVRVTLVSTEPCKSAVIVEERRVGGPSLLKPDTVLVMNTLTVMVS
jgi:hypothetical protein